MTRLGRATGGTRVEKPLRRIWIPRCPGSSAADLFGWNQAFGKPRARISSLPVAVRDWMIRPMEVIETEVLVIGAGPGGYAAAFYAADLGKKAVLVEKEGRLGGVCLNHGCIPSKALLHATELVHEIRLSAQRGIAFGPPRIDLERLRSWKAGVLERLGQGIGFLARKRGVEVLRGHGRFENSTTLRLDAETGPRQVQFENAIIAVGSSPAVPDVFEVGDPRVMTSREALELPEIPGSLLVIGGGYIGMELGTLYAFLGSEVTVIEALGSILAGADADLVRPVMNFARSRFKEIRLKTTVRSLVVEGDKIKVTAVLPGGETRDERYDRVLVAVGCRPNHDGLGLENTRVRQDEDGFLQVDGQRRTDDPAIFAVGDCVGGALLAHKAHRESRVAVEAICGREISRRNPVIPAVVFTHPEVAWCGLTAAEAEQAGRPIRVAKFRWAASGRALCTDRTDGLTKLIIDPETERLLGVGLAGTGAGEMIGEGVLAIEIGATARDLASIAHPHPTLSETLTEAAESFYGCATHSLTQR